MQALYNKYASKGAVFILDVGQNGGQYPATQTDAANYKSSHGYQAGWIALADPNWQGVSAVITDYTNTLPNFSVLDGTMKLVHTTQNGSWLNAAEQAIKQLVQ